MNRRDSTHVFLRASSSFQIVSSSAEKALHELGYDFMQNRTKELNEFEVTKPVYFRIVVEKRKDPEVSNLLLPSIKEAKGCVVDIWFLQEHSDEEYARAFSCARNFLKALVSSLPCPPWEGLRFRESGKEKKRWKELIG